MVESVTNRPNQIAGELRGVLRPGQSGEDQVFLIWLAVHTGDFQARRSTPDWSDPVPRRNLNRLFLTRLSASQVAQGKCAGGHSTRINPPENTAPATSPGCRHRRCRRNEEMAICRTSISSLVLIRDGYLCAVGLRREGGLRTPNESHQVGYRCTA